MKVKQDFHTIDMVLYQPGLNLTAPASDGLNQTNVALTSLANKGQLCVTDDPEPLPIIPHGAAGLRSRGQTGPVSIIS